MFKRNMPETFTEDANLFVQRPFSPRASRSISLKVILVVVVVVVVVVLVLVVLVLVATFCKTRKRSK